MSKAFKCDRCGKMFEGQGDCTLQITRPNFYFTPDVLEYDLCAGCHQGLVAFINEIQGEERHYEIQS